MHISWVAVPMALLAGHALSLEAARSSESSNPQRRRSTFGTSTYRPPQASRTAEHPMNVPRTPSPEILGSNSAKRSKESHSGKKHREPKGKNNAAVGIVGALKQAKSTTTASTYTHKKKPSTKTGKWASSSGLTCTMSSSSMTLDMVTAFCNCNNKEQRTIVSDLDNPYDTECPPTSEFMLGSQTLDDLREYALTISNEAGYTWACQHNKTTAIRDGPTSTMCINTSWIHVPTSALSVLPKVGHGILVGQMTAEALSRNISDMIVSACTIHTTMTVNSSPSPILACEPTMSVPGVSYPGAKGIDYGTFGFEPQNGMFFPDADMLAAAANATGAWAAGMIAHNTTAACPTINPSYSTTDGGSVNARLRRWLRKRIPFAQGGFSAPTYDTNTLPLFDHF